MKKGQSTSLSHLLLLSFVVGLEEAFLLKSGFFKDLFWVRPDVSWKADFQGEKLVVAFRNLGPRPLQTVLTRHRFCAETCSFIDTQFFIGNRLIDLFQRKTLVPFLSAQLLSPSWCLFSIRITHGRLSALSVLSALSALSALNTHPITQVSNTQICSQNTDSRRCKTLPVVALHLSHKCTQNDHINRSQMREKNIFRNT